MHTRTPVLLLLPHTPKAHLPPQPDPATLLAAGRPWRARRLLLDGRVAEVRQQVGGTNASIAEWAAALGLLLLDRLFKPSTPPGPPNSVALPLPNAVTPWTLPVLLAAFVFHLGARVLCPTMRMPPPPPPLRARCSYFTDIKNPTDPELLVLETDACIFTDEGFK